ncbi:MAG: redoxin domain-containing protein [Candidatus Fermentibacteraceae bacterium]
MAAEMGDVLEDFELSDQEGEKVRLSDLRGKRVLLSFHPLAWTGICTKQMQALEEAMDRFDSLGVVPLGVSVDAVPTKKAWADDMGLERLRILSDFWPHGEVARSADIFIEKLGFSGRGNIALDEEGRVIMRKIYEIKELPDLEEVLAELSG